MVWDCGNEWNQSYHEFERGERVTPLHLGLCSWNRSWNHTDQRLPLVATQWIAHKHHSFPPHSHQKINPAEPTQHPTRIKLHIFFSHIMVNRSKEVGFVLPRKLAIGRFPAVLEVICVASAIHLAVKPGVNDGASRIQVQRVRFIINPAARKYITRSPIGMKHWASMLWMAMAVPQTHQQHCRTCIEM